MSKKPASKFSPILVSLLVLLLSVSIVSAGYLAGQTGVNAINYAIELQARQLEAFRQQAAMPPAASEPRA